MFRMHIAPCPLFREVLIVIFLLVVRALYRLGTKGLLSVVNTLSCMACRGLLALWTGFGESMCFNFGLYSSQIWKSNIIHHPEDSLPLEKIQPGLHEK